MLSSPENEKSKKIYENHQKKFLKYALSTGQESFKEETMVNYFTTTYKNMTYSPGSFWQMFSCIRSYVLVKTKIDIKSFTLLKKLIKSLVVKHLKKKASIFTSEEILKALKEFYNDNDPRELVNKISVCLAYYGLLRLEEVISLQKKDIVLDLTDDIEVNYPYSTKRSVKGFSFKVPGWLKPTFALYTSQFPDNASPNDRFLKNWSKKKDGKGRIQNWGQHNLAKNAKAIATWLQKEGNYTAHSFRRSGATALAESGISVVGLCHAGRWKSLVTAQEYQEDTDLQKSDRASRMDGNGGAIVPYQKKLKVGHSDEELKEELVQSSVVHGNTYVINISGEGTGNYSFLNGVSGGLSSDDVGAVE